jgi:LysR family transcriptional regulator, nod-box dependent transcriptional activator
MDTAQEGYNPINAPLLLASLPSQYVTAQWHVMHFKGLDLNLLVVLDALLTEKNTTKAGQRIYLSQSATSGALSRLREFFGDPLLIQSGHKMILTTLAEGLVEPVRQLLREAEAIISVNTAFDPKTSTRTFRLNMSHYSALVLLPNAMKTIKKTAPSVRIEVTSLQEDIADALERGDLDFLVVPDEFKSPLHPAVELFDDSYVCVAWSENPLIRKTITLEQYLSMGHVVARFGRAQGKAFDETCLLRAGYSRRVELVVPDFSIIPSFVIGSNLIATMHERHARFHARYLPLRVFPLPIELPRFSAKIQWHRYHDHDPGTKWLHGILKEAAKKEC